MKHILQIMETADLTAAKVDEAKVWLGRLIWYYASEYRVPGDTRPRQFSGLLPAQVKDMMEAEHANLLVAAGLKSGTLSMPTLHKYMNQGERYFWNHMEEVGARRRRENLELLEESKHEAAMIMRDMEASRGVRLQAIRTIADVTREEGLIVGYHSPQRLGIFQDDGADKLITSDEMNEAVKFTEQWSQKLLDGGDTADGENVP